jgi:hypothetical protein
MKKNLLGFLLLSLHVVAPCVAHAQDGVRPGKKYDRVTDSTTWAFGLTDRVLFHAQGEQPTCATRITVLLFDSLIDYPKGTAATARQKLLIPDPPTFRLLIDSAGVMTRTTIVGLAVEAQQSINYYYPVPDSLRTRFRAATSVEGSDNRTHRFRWDQKKLKEAPQICSSATNP